MIDPFALSKPHVAIVGMAAVSRHLAPYDDPDVEIWSINESYHPRNKSPKSTWKKRDEPEPYLKRWDRWFQLHPKWDYMRLGNFNHENHPYWITNKSGSCLICSGKGKVAVPGKEDRVCAECDGSGLYDPAKHRRTLDFPIYLQDADPDVPGGVVYPFHDSGKTYGINEEHVKYHTNSMTLMLAFAMHIGLDRVEDGKVVPVRGERLQTVSIWGFEMSSATEYGDQKPAAEFWLGILVGRAVHERVKLVLPDGCSLLGGTVPLYAFDKVPGLTSMHAEIRVNALNQALQKAQSELNHIRGAKNLLLSKMKNTKGMSKAGVEKMQKEMNELAQGEFDKVCECNSLFGALQEAKHTHAEVKQARTSNVIGYMGASGQGGKVDLTEYERTAVRDAQVGLPEDRSDEATLE